MSVSTQLRADIIQRALARHMFAVKIIEHELDRRTPVDTGHLKHSRRVVTHPGTVQIQTRFSYDAKYAQIVDQGPRAHRIVAKNAKTLRFKAGGRVIYRRSVNWRPGPGVARNKGFFSDTVTGGVYRAAYQAGSGVR